MSSTLSISSARYSRSSGLHGAKVTPQLPITTLVTPWKQLLLADRVPRQLGVEVGVDVDEAGGDERPSASISRRPRPAESVLDGDDAVADDADIGPPCGRAGAVDHRASSDDDVVLVVALVRCVVRSVWLSGLLVVASCPTRPVMVGHVPLMVVEEGHNVSVRL